jgi:hypothetical protein
MYIKYAHIYVQAAMDLTSPTRGILQLYPEIGYFRDIIFMFKLVMVPTLDMLPEVKCWDPENAVLSWGNIYMYKNICIIICMNMNVNIYLCT